MKFILQDPDETLTHSIDWVSWLDSAASPPDTMSSASWAISPNDASPAPTVADLGESGTVVSVDVSGLVRGEIYRLTCDMVSVAGEIGQQSIHIRCDHK